MNVFVIHPYRGKENGYARNKDRLDRICRYLALAGVVPFSPVHAYGFLCDFNEEEREVGLACGDRLLRLSDEAWVMADYNWTWEQSEGSRREIQTARKLGIPVRRTVDKTYWARVRAFLNELSQKGEATDEPDVVVGALQELSLDGPRTQLCPSQNELWKLQKC